MATAHKKTLVILGGGLGGLPLARLIESNKKLSQSLQVVLVDKKQYFEVNMASPRFLVAPEHHGEFSGLFTSYLNKTRFVCGEVRTVQAQPQQVEVATESGTEFIPYDFLVIALGTRYPYFKADAQTLQGRIEEITRMSGQIRNANHILVVGGRSVGVEVVGEILHQQPDKQITIVHPMNTLMDGWPSSGLKKLNKYVEKKAKNVRVITGKKLVRSLENNRHELSDGTIIEADLKILATGVTPNSESLRQFFGPSLTPAGYIKVRDTLQLEGFGNIFAFGDIAELNHPKMGANLKGQIQVILKNLQATLNDKRQTPLGAPMMVYPGLVTLGPDFAILALPLFGGSSFSGKMYSNMKTNMFVKMGKAP